MAFSDTLVEYNLIKKMLPLFVTLVNLCDTAFLQGSRRAVHLCVDHTLGSIKADGKRCWLVHLQTGLLLDNTYSHAQRCPICLTTHLF